MYRTETHALRGAIYAVYKELGSGYLEEVYQEALEIELTHRAIPFVSQPRLRIQYNGERLEKKYIPDLVCYEKIIVELKVAQDLCGAHKAQLLNYLKTTGLKMGLLVNFGNYPNVDIFTALNGYLKS